MNVNTKHERKTCHDRIVRVLNSNYFVKREERRGHPPYPQSPDDMRTENVSSSVSGDGEPPCQHVAP